MAVSISISITQNSQNTTNNTSNVTVKVNAKWTGGSYNLNKKSGWLKIDGTTYDFTSSFNTGQSTSGSQTLFTKTVDVAHNEDGTKTLSCSASYTSGVSSGTVKASASKALTTIPRKSIISAVSASPLGEESTITVNRQVDDFTHTLKYTCGTASGTIVSKSTATSIKWTPPLSLANQNTTGTDLTIVFTLTTYDGDSEIATSEWTSYAYSIPNSIVPTVSIAPSDVYSYRATFGAYIQNKSKLNIPITASGAYGSTIKSYKTTVDGKTYTTKDVTTSVLSSYGNMTITTTATDTRNRTATVNWDITVLQYALPKLTGVKAQRCNQDGSLSSSGEYLRLDFNSNIASLNSKNTASYSVKYKKTTESTYNTPITLTNYNNNLSVVNGSYVFLADTASSYDIVLTATDGLDSTSEQTTGSSIKTLWSWLKGGFGMAVGKIAEDSNVFDVGFAAKFRDTVTLANNKFVFADDKDNVEINILGVNNNNNMLIGWDLYDKALGNTVLYGNQVRINTKDGFYLDGKAVLKDSGWIYPTLSSQFAIYSDAYTVKYRKIGNQVNIIGCIKPTAQITGSADRHTIFTLLEGYRPSMEVITICQGSSANVWNLMITEDGIVSFARYRNSSSYASCPTSAWLSFNTTYFTD